ncbi:hypothetical protein K501DRAFT_296998 [Backusella circina FSU 941]|nr:hypothetical protein K501DRAFT_296998 [Backusella circina FSU 941]
MSIQANTLIKELNDTPLSVQPLNTIMLERTAATYLIIFIVNQLFISNNDREFFSTDRTKFDGIILKVGDKSIAPGLVEFSGGINDKTSSQKNAKDIEKLYTNMVKVMEDIKTDKMLCMKCFGHNIYFEKLVHYDGVMYRTADVVVEIVISRKKTHT